MKKCLTIFIIAILSIIPTLRVNALDITLKDNTNLTIPDFPSDDNTGHIVLLNKWNYYHLYTFDKSAGYPDLKVANNDNKYLYVGFEPYEFSGNVIYNWYYASTTASEWGVNKLNKDCYSCSIQSDDQTYIKVIYSDVDVVIDGYDGASYTGFDNANLDKTSFTVGDTIYYADNLKKELLNFEFEKVENENNTYYDILFSANEFNEDYTYKIQINNNGWVNITNYLKNGHYNYQLLYNATLYMSVTDKNGNYIETKTFEFTDLINESEYKKPTATIDINYTSNSNNFSQANVTFNFKNYSSYYSYHYSLNGIENNIIEPSDITNNSYSFTTYQNTTVYLYIYDIDGNIVFETSKKIIDNIDNENIKYYEFDLKNFYDSDNNKLKHLTLYYDNIFNKTNISYINIYLKGSSDNVLPFFIQDNKNVIDLQKYSNNIDFSNSIFQFLPYEKYTTSEDYQSYTNYTTYTIMPYIDLANDTFDNYKDYKVVIRTNLNLEILAFKSIDSVNLPNYNEDRENYNYLKTLVNKILNPIYEKLPILTQFWDIYQVFNYDYNENATPPKFSIDLSFLGASEEVEVIDFKYFIEYRDYLFLLFKVILGFYTLRGVIRNISNGGDK